MYVFHQDSWIENETLMTLYICSFSNEQEVCRIRKGAGCWTSSTQEIPDQISSQVAEEILLFRAVYKEVSGPDGSHNIVGNLQVQSCLL